MSGFFITFEGGEGSGKTTQIDLLAGWLEARGLPAPLLTREPGGTAASESIRELLLTGEVDRWDAATEALLMSASRRHHVDEVIRPALERGRLVICDRFFDSTRIYQGVVGGVPHEDIEALGRISCGDLEPDLTLVLDMDVEHGLERAGARGSAEMRFERKGVAFHKRVKQAYRDLAEAHPERIVVIDARRTPESVASDIESVVAERMPVLDAV